MTAPAIGRITHLSDETKHYKLKLATALEPTPRPGWIVMQDYGPYDGGLQPDEPHMVYFDRDEALRVARETMKPGDDYPNVVIEVSIPC